MNNEGESVGDKREPISREPENLDAKGEQKAIPSPWTVTQHLLSVLLTTEQPREVLGVLGDTDQFLSLDEVATGFIARYNEKHGQVSDAPVLRLSALERMLVEFSRVGLVEVDGKGHYALASAARLDVPPPNEFMIGLTDVSQRIQTVADLKGVLGAFGVHGVNSSEVLRVVDDVANARDQRLRQLDTDILKYIKPHEPGNT